MASKDDGIEDPSLRKARKSWFDNTSRSELAAFDDSVKENRSPQKQRKPKRLSLDAVENLTLTHFTRAPKISFGKVLVGKSKLRTLLVRIFGVFVLLFPQNFSLSFLITAIQ